ncbi:CSS-motif domain-containing protein [Candidatus Pantoea persica]|uniref:CSS-motif domain-containing protein n=1 Tax=Candidatus Pantoea persica TaxID=2518128 RepID=UPI0035A8692D
MPCDAVRFPLIEKISALQTVHAILLVEHDRIYCSSIYGPRAIPLARPIPNWRSITSA